MDFKEKLIESGYSEIQANMVIDKLSKVDDLFKDGLQGWAAFGKMKEYAIDQINTTSLMDQYGLSYPAAVLTLDWVKRDPITAKEAIKRGIK